MFDKVFLPPQKGFVKLAGSVNNTDIPGTHHFHLRYKGVGPPSLSWSPLFKYNATQYVPKIDIKDIIGETKVESTKIIMVCHSGPKESFWRELFKGAFFGAQKHDIELKIRYPKIFGDYVNQLRLIEESISHKPALLATTLPEPDIFLPVLREAQKEGISVLLFNTKNIQGTATDPFAFPSIGGDDYQIGGGLVKKALKYIPSPKRFVIITHLSGPIGFEQCVMGIKHQLIETDIQIDRLTLGSDLPNPKKVFDAYLEAHPDLSGIFCLRGTLLEMIYESLLNYSQKYKRPRLFCATYDKTKLALQLLEKGFLDFIVDCRPFVQGLLSVNLPSKSYKIKPVLIERGRRKKVSG